MRHANTHRTRSIDYAIVLEGEIDMLMDDTEVRVKAGDTLVQQGTNHAWINNGGQPCRIAFILIDAVRPHAWKRELDDSEILNKSIDQTTTGDRVRHDGVLKGVRIA